MSSLISRVANNHIKHKVLMCNEQSAWLLQMTYESSLKVCGLQLFRIFFVILLENSEHNVTYFFMYLPHKIGVLILTFYEITVISYLTYPSLQ